MTTLERYLQALGWTRCEDGRRRVARQLGEAWAAETIEKIRRAVATPRRRRKR